MGAWAGPFLPRGGSPLGFLIALGACIATGAVFLLLAVISAFRALSPKRYSGVDEKAVVERTRPSALRSDPAEALATFAASRRDVLLRARQVNDQKAKDTTRTFFLAGIGFTALVLAVLVVAVGSVT